MIWDWKARAPYALPMSGKFEWPGRDRLSIRERLLLEARTLTELAVDGTANIEGDIEASVGYLEYLIADWAWLRYPERRKSFGCGNHNYRLRKNSDYAKEIGWTGEIPRDEHILDFWGVRSN